MGVTADGETLEPAVTGAGERHAVPALTIAFHPALDRIGERVRLTDLRVGRAIVLARNEPAFTAPGSETARPLLDPYVSRRPISLAPAADGAVEITARGPGLVVDGQPVAGARVVPRAALDRGVTLELADRVVLLLHLLREPRPRGPALGLVGEHELVEDLRRDVRRVADLEVPVLIRGETGTGKELIARAVHDHSRRAGSAFVPVNVAAIPAAAAAAELFGHARGAFTGADAARTGYFERAAGGTLFLDEIGATPREIQPMLLRALESREIQPLGTAIPRAIDVRIIAATDADLERAIEEGSFRSAVLHRLDSYRLAVPALRDRREDIGRLLAHFLRDELAAIGELERLAPADPAAPPWLPPAVVGAMLRQAWPGNVRQLRNVVRQLCISSRGLPCARVDSRLEQMLAGGPDAPAATGSGEVESLTDDDLVAALRAHDHRIGAAAAALGVSRSALYNRIKDSARIRQAKDLGAEEIARSRERCSGDITLMARELEVSRRALVIRMRELESAPGPADP